MLDPSAQKAGHRPAPAGTLIRASTWPYPNETLSLLTTRPLVKSAFPPGPEYDSLRAVMARWPCPSRELLARSWVYPSIPSSRRAPSSLDQYLLFGADPALPEKSSSNSVEFAPIG